MFTRRSFPSSRMVLCFLFASGTALASEQRPADPGTGCETPWAFARVDSTRACSSAEGPEAVGPERLLLSALMRAYETAVSPVGGQRCAMYPSCSSYAREGIDESGVFVGVMMACDRLLRCGNDLQFYDPIRRDGRVLRRDPVSGDGRCSQ